VSPSHRASETPSIAHPARFESLEHRVLLHSSASELLELGLPESMILGDGRITYADFRTLSSEQQAHIDPHLIRDPLGGDGPVDFDALLGIPLSVQGRGNPEADAYPDWFPSLNGGSISLDQTSQPGRSLVKFPSGIHNQGSGPGIAISGRPGVDPIPTGAPITSWLNADGSHAILQPIYSLNGNTFVLSHYRYAGSFTYHAGHGHLHFDGYAYYRLRHNVGGQPGAYVDRPDGTGIIGEKIGFCLINTGSSFTMENGQSSITLPGYNASGQPSVGCGLVQGVHVGKTDGYGVGTTGQWLDVTGVPNGQYFLEIMLDAENAMMETNEANNAKTFPFTLNVNPPAGGILPDQFDISPVNNDTFANAVDVGVMSTFSQTGLTIHWGMDFDYFRFVAASSGPATVTAAQASGNVDIYLYDAGQTQIGASTNASGNESISYSFVAGQTYYLMARAYNSTTSSNYQVAWNLKPTATAAATTPTAGELGGNYGMIALARNGPDHASLTVNFTVGGTATRGVDYQIFHEGFEVTGNSVIISAINQAAMLEIRPIHDSIPEPTETVIITLGTGSTYVVGEENSATVTIFDSGPAVSQVSQVWQTSPHKLLFDVARLDASTVQVSDFSIVNLDTNQPVTPQNMGVTSNGNSSTVTLTFNGVLPDGRYRATLIGAGITNSFGDPMFGNFEHNFFVLTGDADHDGRVNLNDFNIMAANFGQSGRDASQGDFTYDGIVNLDDFNVLASKFGMSLFDVASGSGRGSGTAGLPPLAGVGNAFGGGNVFSSGRGIEEGEETGLLAGLA
jgi:hypothetical protein